VDDATTFIWQTAAGAGGYSVEVLDGVTQLRKTDVFLDLDYTYSVDDMLADVGAGAPVREITFKLTAYNTAVDPSPAAEFTTVNEKPAVLTTPSAVLDTGTTYDFSWDAPALPDDFLEYRIYGSVSSGFTPGATNLLYSGALNSASIDVGSTPFYWVVAAFDKYAVDHEDAIFTTEQTIA
jgi:hypothetical protein